MRCDGSNGAAKRFAQSAQSEAMVKLKAPSAADLRDYGCPADAPQVRSVRCVSADAQVRVMAANLPAAQVPPEAFAQLYHQRWRIEEAFKRLKTRCKLESVSDLTQHALLVDVFAKVLADNLAFIVCSAALTLTGWASDTRLCNRAYAQQCLQRLLPRMLLGLGDPGALLHKALKLLVANTARRPKHQVKPHPFMAYKA